MTRNETVEPGATDPEQKGPMAVCPMAAACRGMAEKPYPNLLLLLPGLLFVAVGLLILLVPALLVWLFALACIGIGVMMLILASALSRMGKRFGREHP